MDWNGTISVSRDSEGKTGFVSLHVDKILFFRIVKGQLQAHTEDEYFYLNGGEIISRLLQTLHASGYFFVKSDREDIPDIGKIRKFSRAWKRAYFTDNPNSQSKFVYIARFRYEEFVELTMKHNDFIKNNVESRE